jgi:tRNA A37 threonylcarbamoyladenosine biosynthesis protein TsaE
MIIGINGKIGSGKDTVGKIIQGLIVAKEHNVLNPNFEWIEKYHINSSFEIKKFAWKLKQTASLLTGVPVEKFEDQDFKKQVMSKEWIQPKHYNCENYDIEDGGGNCSFCSCKEGLIPNNFRKNWENLDRLIILFNVLKQFI